MTNHDPLLDAASPLPRRAGPRILICGASGNLGGHTARLLARPGTRLALWGRDASRLEETASQCRAAGAIVSVRSVDLRHVEAAVDVLRVEDDAAGFDMAFFLSGSGDTREDGRIFESAALVIKLGVLNFVAPAALAAELSERMARRGSGRIAMVGTAAATHPLPFAAAYASSKCGLAQFAEALRIALAPSGVTVTLVSPGFFAAQAAGTHAYARPGEISAEQVAQRMISAVERGRRELVTPLPFVLLRWLGRLLPRPVRDALLRKLPSP